MFCAILILNRHQRRRFKYSVSSLSKNVAKDFNLDETAAARLTLGLGDSAMPGVSLFAMPMIDVASLAPVTVSGVESQSGAPYLSNVAQVATARDE